MILKSWSLRLKTFPPKTNRPCVLSLYYLTNSFQQQEIMLKFVISLMRKIISAAEANVPPAEIMAKLQSDNNVLRNNSRKLAKHLEARLKILEAIDDLSDHDTPYITSLQHA